MDECKATEIVTENFMIYWYDFNIGLSPAMVKKGCVNDCTWHGANILYTETILMNSEKN